MDSAKKQSEIKESTLKEDVNSLPEEPSPVVIRKEQEKDLFIWTAPARPFKRRDRKFYMTVVVVAIIVGIVLFLFEGFMPVILIISVLFLFYIMNTVEPDNIEYKITNEGIKIAGRKNKWGGLGRFWFTRRFDSELLIIETSTLPGRLEIVVSSNVKETVRKTLSSYLPEEEIPPAWLDKAANWFSKKLPQN
jgi:hypothetical protein